MPRAPATTSPRGSRGPTEAAGPVPRAIAFERQNLALAAGHSEPHPLGCWIRSEAHPEMWSMNQLYVEGPQPGLGAGALIAELDRGLADAGHRRAVVTDDATGRALADGMRAAGYTVGPLGVMLLDREPPAPGPDLAREVGEREIRVLEELMVLGNPEIPERDRPVVLEGHAHMRTSIPGTRRFAGLAAGEPVCQTTLFCHSRIGQPEDVETLAAYRGRGIGAATVSLAAREAVAAGCELVFIVCNLVDGPVALYGRLGFRALGRFWTFNRQL